MEKIAVIAHNQKVLGKGLAELRRNLAARGYSDPLWCEVDKSRKATKWARRAVKEEVDLLFAWGGDGTVQRCIEAVAGTAVTLVILPAGTANLLANNLKIPIDLDGAVEVGFRGNRRQIDVGILNDEHFGVMAGAGFDAQMMRDADGNLKDRFGRLAYVFTGARAMRMKPRKMSIRVDGKKWFKGEAICVLLGQMGMIGSGVVAFPDAVDDDGQLEVGVITAKGALEMTAVLARMVVGHPEYSRFTQMTRAHAVDIKIDKPIAYELDGGTRKASRRLLASVAPGALRVCVPKEEPS